MQGRTYDILALFHQLTNSLGESVQLGKAKKHANFYSMIEKMYTAAKTHRNIIDIEFAVCSKY